MAALKSMVGRSCAHMQGKSKLPSTLMAEVERCADQKGKCARPQTVFLRKSKDGG